MLTVTDLLTYGLGDAPARISRSFMEDLHPSLLYARCIASWTDQPISPQSSFIISIHRFFCLPLFLFPCTYPLRAIFGYLSFPIRVTCPKYRSRLFCILLTMSYLMFSRLCISLFLILSLLVSPSILRKHAISKTLSRCLCVSFSVQVSELYSNALSTSVSYNLTFVPLLISLELQTFPSA